MDRKKSKFSTMFSTKQLNKFSFIKIDSMVDSNILVVNSNHFVLPKGHTLEPNPENGVLHGKYIEKGKYKQVVAIYNFKNGKLEGECKYYKKGCLKEKWNYANGVAKGWGIGIERYKEVKFYVYENGKKVECKKSDELDKYWDILDNGLRVKCCKLNDEKKEYGVGYVFEGEKIARVVEFVNGEEVRILKEFDEEGKMREYDERGDLVYVGDYCGNVKEGFRREGKKGREIRGDELVYVGEWKNGKRNGYGVSLVNGFAEYEGEWKENLPDGEGVYMENDEIKYEGKWNKGGFKTKENKLFKYQTKKASIELKTVEIISEDEKEIGKKSISLGISSTSQFINLLNNNKDKEEVKELIVHQNCCNDMEDDLEIRGFEKMEKIVFKMGCLQKLNSLKIGNCQNLKCIEIEDGFFFCGAFSNVKDVVIESI